MVPSDQSLVREEEAGPTGELTACLKTGADAETELRDELNIGAKDAAV